MKKMLVLVLTLVMMISCAACAEAAFTYGEYNYDESLIADIPGSWYAFEDFGLQMYVPDIFLPYEVTEEQAAQGVIANFVTENNAALMTISYGAAVDVEGNTVEYAEDLAPMFTAAGASYVDVIVVNGYPMVTYMMADPDMLGYSVFFGDGTQLPITFAPASDASVATLAATMITTFQPMA